MPDPSAIYRTFLIHNKQALFVIVYCTLDEDDYEDMQSGHLNLGRNEKAEIGKNTLYRLYTLGYAGRQQFYFLFAFIDANDLLLLTFDCGVSGCRSIDTVNVNKWCS